jgi:hypothetical protein
MTRKIRITAGEISAMASLLDTDTADEIWRALPIEGTANRWGDEIYFAIPLKMQEADDARQDMTVGELAYWPAGSAFCIFFGPTPASDGDQPRAYSNVNPFGKVDSDATAFKSIPDGSRVLVERAKD